jgi:hypothetical protein
MTMDINMDTGVDIDMGMDMDADREMDMGIQRFGNRISM